MPETPTGGPYTRVLRSWKTAGEYSVEIAVETLLNANRAAGAPTSDLMRLRGARLAFTSEPEHGSKFKGGTLKRLATIDLMTGRELHGRQEEWPPTHTLHLAPTICPPPTMPPRDSGGGSH